MATNESEFSGFRVNRSLLAGGAVLTGIGSLLGAAGATMVCVALAMAGRDWMRGLENRPTAVAQRALHEARVASTAGWEAWRAEHGSPN
ncbi:hypothetical protein [Streptomyces rubellomurinus]|uniref:Uncharacterized protein n=2 Tax=Streptomyces TaxID=1883 RepID=A0A0F2TFD3_STRR3|nr:hypothetical protein [Streptomyces rubellomurinus]KJS56941.1 hypothetical protein VM98_04180 [Streptomyces rubellomurinus subsp. indigoferus]KJS61256.1 hypothetical protein VM95_16135 [Streptomyces rubellomurinus]